MKLSSKLELKISIYYIEVIAYFFQFSISDEQDQHFLSFIILTFFDFSFHLDFFSPSFMMINDYFLLVLQC